MIQRAHELIPQVIGENLLAIAKQDPEWVQVFHNDDRTFRVRIAPRFASLRSVCENGADTVSMLAMSHWLLDGPKTFRPTVEQCGVLEQIEVGINLADYAQPYRALLVEPPAGMYSPFVAVVLHHHKGILCANLFTPNNADDIVTVIKHCDRQIEEDIQMFSPEVAEFRDTASRLYRVAINSCLARGSGSALAQGALENAGAWAKDEPAQAGPD